MMRTRFRYVVVLLVIALPRVVAAQAQDEVFYYHLDAIGSVRAITDANGQVVELRDFLPFGEPWPPSAANSDPRQFTAQEHDATTGFDYFAARYYASLNGRFTRADDRGFSDPGQPQTLALYVYVQNNPLRYNDPTGHCPPSVNFCIGVIASDDALWIFESLTRVISLQVGPITPPTLSPTGEIGVCFAKGAAVGAAGAVVVGVLAAGAAAAGAPVVAVTIALGVVGVVGGAAVGIDVISQVKSRNWSGLAYDIGSLGGGAAVGGAGGRALAGHINRVPSPPWSLRSDWAQRYKPGLGSPSEWMGTGPNPGSAGGAAATAGAGAGQALRNGC